MLSTKKAKMSLNKRRERKKFEARELLVAMPRFILGRKARETELLQVRRMDGFKASSMAGWIPISKVFVSVTTVKIYRLKSKPSQ